MIRKSFEYDPELMETARWIVERELHRPREHEIERQLELPLPMPPREPEKRNSHKDPARHSTRLRPMLHHSPPEAVGLISKMHRGFAPAQKPPVCPACGRNMKFARLVEVGLNTFECGPCCVSYTTAAEESRDHMPRCHLTTKAAAPWDAAAFDPARLSG